ncbi:MAG: tetratricopeptide repeat protein [Woeseia sp.]
MNDLSEKETIDELRRWWEENQWFVIGGLVLGVAMLVGWNAWKAQRAESATAASAQYEKLVEQVADGNLDPAASLSAELFDEYGSTPYAAQGRLAMARLYMDRGRDQDAADVLRPLAEASGNEALQQIARLRLASILLYQDKPAEALDLLGTPGESAFAARFNNVIGDAHFALGNFADAAAAWSRVLADENARQTVNSRYVRMKLDDLPDDAALSSAAAELPQDGAGE